MKSKPKLETNLFSEFGKGMKNFGLTLSVLINSILLLFAYLLGVGLTTLIAKITGKHFLELKLDKEKKSYWSELDLKRKPIKEYYRQF
ncbi:MAG TPA: hypothetical protein VJA23_06840 [Candidatus Nanoarchaeia archaeon]|nr:hypothetical protein [Candidatus Nanoarchaeia archaeon]